MTEKKKTMRDYVTTMAPIEDFVPVEGAIGIKCGSVGSGRDRRVEGCGMPTLIMKPIDPKSSMVDINYCPSCGARCNREGHIQWYNVGTIAPEVETTVQEAPMVMAAGAGAGGNDDTLELGELELEDAPADAKSFTDDGLDDSFMEELDNLFDEPDPEPTDEAVAVMDLTAEDILDVEEDAVPMGETEVLSSKEVEDILNDLQPDEEEGPVVDLDTPVLELEPDLDLTLELDEDDIVSAVDDAKGQDLTSEVWDIDELVQFPVEEDPDVLELLDDEPVAAVEQQMEGTDFSDIELELEEEDAPAPPANEDLELDLSPIEILTPTSEDLDAGKVVHMNDWVEPAHNDPEVFNTTVVRNVRTGRYHLKTNGEYSRTSWDSFNGAMAALYSDLLKYMAPYKMELETAV